jgi:predicted esterase
MKTLLHPLLVVSTLLAMTFQLAAQDCGFPGRYNNNIFTEVIKTSGIVFGRNSVRNYSANTDFPAKDLLLDIYQPAGDAVTNRPLVILAFGGGFIGGDRGQMEPIARAFAQKGYVAAAIDYRIVTNTDDQMLLAPFPFSTTTADQKRAMVRDVIVKASADMRAAIRFFRHQAATGNAYRINPEKIFVGGASAGAITALYTAYVDNVTEDPNLTTTYNANGGLEGNTDLPAPNSLLGSYTSTNLAGVINISGALLDVNVVDANDPPLYSAHGDSDDVVPYNSGQFSVVVSGIAVNIPITFYGSKAITDRAIAMGVRNVLLTIPDGEHETPGQMPHIEEIIERASAFMKVSVCGAAAIPTPVKLVAFTVKANRCTALFDWKTAMEENSSHYEIESSTDGVRFAKVGTVNSRNASTGAAYNYQVEGASNAAWFRLKMVDKDGSAAYSKAQRFSPKCEELSVQVYPNPAQHKATVAGVQSGMVVEVLTADGRMIWTQRATGNTVQLPVSSFAKGLMLVQVKSESGALLSRTKLMKD